MVPAQPRLAHHCPPRPQLLARGGSGERSPQGSQILPRQPMTASNDCVRMPMATRKCERCK
eukprot:2280427-Alexandrium_andersonii.AAC.1